MQDETGIGGPRRDFPTTRWSAVVAARSDDHAERERALGAILAAYWKPVYKYLRLRWRRSNEEAKDLTQEFFARLLEKDYLAAYDPRKARLRTFLRTCLDRFVRNQDRDAARRKRGGGAELRPLDFGEAEGELARIAPVPPEAVEELFDREWRRQLCALAVEALERECRERGKLEHFRLFERYDLEDEGADGRPTYSELAAELGLRATDVTNRLAYARRRFRRLVLERLREMTASEEEFRGEARALLGWRAE